MKAKKQFDYHYLINGKRVKVAWHSLTEWILWGGTKKAWRYSLRRHYQGTTCHHSWQLCVMGLNIAIGVPYDK